MNSLMSVAEAVGQGEEVNRPLEEGVRLVSQKLIHLGPREPRSPQGNAQVLPVPPSEKIPL